MSIAQRLLSLGRPFRVLAIETSCDDTAVSILDSSRRIIAHVNEHQHAVHASYRGIVPSLAIQSHKDALPRAIEGALELSRMQLCDIDAIAATRGPGISGCLTVGYESAKALAMRHGKPLYSIHHMVVQQLMQEHLLGTSPSLSPLELTPLKNGS